MSFRRRTTDTIAGLQRELDSLKTQLASASEATAAALPPPPLPATDSDLPPPSMGTSLTDVHDLVKELAARVDGLDTRQLQDHERLSLRLEELTAQLTNQLLEISNELDAGQQQVTSQMAAQEQRIEELAAKAATNGAGADEAGNGASAALVEELRTNQVRIANDLARHEIAVRHDLAALAELVNRSKRG
jgi:hypothetical protein